MPDASFSIGRSRRRTALEALPLLPRIVLLHARQGFDYHEIGSLIGDDVHAVERHLATALKLLVREFEDIGLGDPPHRQLS